MARKNKNSDTRNTQGSPSPGPQSVPVRILLLQGPVGPFFSELANFLLLKGAEVTQLTFNQADIHFAEHRCAIPTTCKIEDFEEHIQLHLETDIDVVILFGAERPAHVLARNAAKRRSIPVLCFEEGYIRPGAITLELDGNNASSPLSKMNISSVPLGPTTRMEAANYRGFWPMIWYGANYYFMREILSSKRERGYHHRETPILRELFFWSRNLTRKLTEGPRHHRLARGLISKSNGDYFVIPLQVSSDSNIKKAANGWTTPKLIQATLQSFARSAPKSSRLVYKVHPMSRGHSSDHKLIENLAKFYGIHDRTIILHEGSLGEIAKNSAGMITINSTSGLSAIHHGIPLLTMGKSIYAHPSLCSLAEDEAKIDAFWTEGTVANQDLRSGFIAHIRRTALIPGDFYARRGREKAVRGATRKILETVTKARSRQ